MLDKKSLQLQYIVDEAGNKKAVIIPHSQFKELLQDMATLAKLVEKGEKSGTKSQTMAPQIVTKERKAVKSMAPQTVAEEQKSSEKQQHDWLNKMLKLPPHFVQDSSLFYKIQSALLMEMSDKQKPPIILQAPSGTGKSVMANALVQDAKIRQTFAENIFWFHLGTEVEVLANQITLIQALGGNSTDIFDVEKATKRLGELCITRRCLVILDDVWEPEDILAFHVGGKHYQLLVTTSENNVLEVIQYFIKEAKNYTLKPFSEEQAIAFFAHSLAQPNVSVIPIDMKEMVRACDYLPLALKLIANVARKGPLSKLENLLDRLLNEDYEFPNKYPRALMQALRLNVEALGEEGDYYITLAVFGDYSRIPESVVLILWHYLYQIREDKAKALINELAENGLLQIDDTSSHRYLSLHTFQHDYISAESDLERLHGHLLAAYRIQCVHHGWISGPNDGYFFEYLCMHLHHAKRDNELKSLLLDFDWLQNKLQATSIYALLNDYEWIENKQVEEIKKALYDAALLLVTEKQELANQLLDNLLGEKSSHNNKDIQALLNQARETSPNWRWQPQFPDKVKVKR